MSGDKQAGATLGRHSGAGRTSAQREERLEGGPEGRAKRVIQ